MLSNYKDKICVLPLKSALNSVKKSFRRNYDFTEFCKTLFRRNLVTLFRKIPAKFCHTEFHWISYFHCNKWTGESSVISNYKYLNNWIVCNLIQVKLKCNFAKNPLYLWSTYLLISSMSRQTWTWLCVKKKRTCRKWF